MLRFAQLLRPHKFGSDSMRTLQIETKRTPGEMGQGMRTWPVSLHARNCARSGHSGSTWTQTGRVLAWSMSDSLRRTRCTDATHVRSHGQLWKARTLVESAYHPDTGELIPRYFRFSAFVPMYVPAV